MIFLVVGRAKILVVSAVADCACLPTSVCVIVAKLAKFRIQAATRSNERMPTKLEGMAVFVAVQATPPFFSEGISARRKKAALKGRVVCYKRGTNNEKLLHSYAFLVASSSMCGQAKDQMNHRWA